MESIIQNLPHYLEVSAQYLGALVVIATIIVKITPSESDNKKVAQIADFIFKVFSYFPTLGKNPNTQALEKAYKNLMDEMNQKV